MMRAMRQRPCPTVTRRRVLALAMALLPGGLPAQVPVPAAVAEVEIIVFRQRDPRGSTPEVPPPAATTPVPDPSATVAAPAFAGIAPAALPATALRLGALAARLRSAGAWELLYHGGWTQTITTQEAALATPLPTEAREPGLEGTVTLYQERFLHVLVAMQLATAGSGLPPAKIHEERRLRGQGLHYFDHPQFGVILEVRTAAANPPATP